MINIWNRCVKRRPIYFFFPLLSTGKGKEKYMDKEYRSIQMMTISHIDYIPKGQIDQISA
jgi:hypothetical protein